MFHATNYLTDEGFILLRKYDPVDRGTLAVEAYPIVKIPRDVAKRTATIAAKRLQSQRFPWGVTPGPLASELWS